jgi:hypothetical protein
MTSTESDRRVNIDLADIDIPQDGPETRYANNVFVTHTAWDFSLVFAHLDLMPSPGGEEVPRYANRLVAKIVISPALVKGLVRALKTNAEGYERQYGVELPERVELKHDKDEEDE